MPELPEIETVKIQLGKVLVGQVCKEIKILSNKVVKGNIDKIVNKKVVNVERKGKVLLINFGDDIRLGFHFKMTGQLIYEEGDTKIVGGHPTEDFVKKMPSSHTRVIFEFDRGTLYFNDQRLFGWIEINPKFVDNLGPEPFEIDGNKFFTILSSLRKPIKAALMEQDRISGVGNIYANDACWEAKIDPRRLANTLSREEYEELYRGLVKVLEEGIKYGGATSSDYVDLRGLGGHYQDHFRTYKQDGKECKRCKSVIEKIMLGGRGTYYCPNCQK